MENLLILISCFLLGIIFRRSGSLPESTAPALNAFVIRVSLPALTLLHIHEIELHTALVYPVAMAWIMFGIGVIFFRAMQTWAGWSPQTVGGLILTGSLANTSFVGLPMIEAFYGSGNGELAIGILIDQLGTYMVLCTLGIYVAVVYSAGDLTLLSMAKKIVSFPPFMALAVAFLLIPVEYPDWLKGTLGRLGGTLAPLALMSVGFQLQLAEIGGRVKGLALGLGYKLILGPAMIFGLFVGMFGAGGNAIQITIFEAAMAPQIGGAIIAMEHKLDTPLVTLMVGIGIPLSFLTLPVWWYVLQSV